MARLEVVKHPLIQHKLTMLRDRATSGKDFRELLDEISTLMAFEVTRHLPLRLKRVRIRTPLAPATGRLITGKMLGVIPILRAGLGMAGGILKLVPGAKVGHVGLYRNPKTLRPVEYFVKLPRDLARRFLIIVDPMLATGYSAAYCADLLQKRGAKPDNITLMTLISCPSGIRVFRRLQPKVNIFTAAIDPVLDRHGYIRPGLGDAGDRLFGTR
ncbi:MAG: uracil phosphoribosyltransferase [bacterium]